MSPGGGDARNPFGTILKGLYVLIFSMRKRVNPNETNINANHEIERSGLDFAAADHTWTEDLCRKDSDGDLLTNGEELGA